MEGNKNADTLRREGLIDDSDEPLPHELYEAIDAMSDDEISALISLKRRVEEAGIRVIALTASNLRDERGIWIL